jgi:predicted peroxiredoxin
MADTKNFLIVVNTPPDHPYNHYAAYVVAFLAKKLGSIPTVNVYYGPEGVRMTKKGELAKLACSDDLKNLIADQVDGLNASDLPNNMEQMARFCKEELGVGIYSCGTFHVVDGLGQNLDDTASIEDFIVPLQLPQAAEALLAADKTHYL